MRVAYFSPLPPVHSGIADYSAGLLPSLSRLAEIDLWVEADDTLSDRSLARLNYVRDPGLLRQLPNYDAVLYHLGNSPIHINIYQAFSFFPGVVVLHDFVLHHFLAGYFLDHLRAPGRYVKEMEYSHGAEGRRLAEEFLSGNRATPWEIAPFKYPLNKRIIDQARGIIVHSRFAGDLVSSLNQEVPVRQINHFVQPERRTQSINALRRKYNLPLDKLIIATIGFGTPSKRTNTTIRALRGLDRDKFVYLIVGEMPVGMLDRQALQQMTVRSTGYVETRDFADYLQLIDICVNLRWPTMGETSGTACRVMGAGKACVVSDVGWFSELPNDCVVKVPIDGREEETLTQELTRLIESPRLRASIGERAMDYITEHCRVEDIAKAYVDFLSEAEDRRFRQSARRHLIKAIGGGLARIGVGEADVEFIEAVTARVADAFRGLGDRR